jgi:hypothetical protein
MEGWQAPNRRGPAVIARPVCSLLPTATWNLLRSPSTPPTTYGQQMCPDAKPKGLLLQGRGGRMEG